MNAKEKPDRADASPYRWAALGAYMLITIAVEAQWVALAPVARAAGSFYGSRIPASSPFGIDFLAMSYLLVFLVASLPASFAIDAWGLRAGLVIGAALAGAGGLLKGFAAAEWGAVLCGQLLLALAQPFILNAATTLGARWFPLRERGLAVALASLAQFLGIVLAMVLGPIIVDGDPASTLYGSGTDRLLLIYGVGTATAAVVAAIIVKDGPAGSTREARRGVGSPVEGLRLLLASRDFRLLLVLFAAGLGIFNALSSLVDAVAAHIGVVDSDGMIGTVMIAGGIVGALVLPILSDAAARRKPFLTLCMAGMIPGVAGLAWARIIAPDPGSAYLVAKVASGILGFFVMAAGPIGFQYAAEIGRPAPESTSQGLLLLVGQATGIGFMALMGTPGLMGPTLAIFVGFAALCFAGTFLLKESTLLDEARAERKSAIR
ncbi:MAG: MFS transporter [Spirochaetaceae bacterium]|nr:MFS transporter [Spirochaetaceae bacterium]